MLYSIVAVLIIIIDQAVKLYINNMVVGGETVKSFIPGVISLVRVQNDGAAFSFLAGGGARIWFIVLTLIFVVMVIIALATNFISGRFGRWCMVMVAAGGLGNCIDRVLYGYVLDMFRVDLFDFAVFNVADIFITVGCIAFILYVLFGGEKEFTPADRFEEEDDEEEDTPVRKPLFSKKKRDYEADYDYDDDDEDDDDEDYVVVSKKAPKKAKSKPEPEKKPVRNTRRAASNNSDEVLARARAARDAEAAAKRRSAEEEAQAFEDFFKKRVESKRTSAAPSEAPRTSRPTVERPERPVAAEPRTPVYSRPVEQVPQRRPEVKKEEPVVTKPAPSSSFDDFDLDSILNEFK